MAERRTVSPAACTSRAKERGPRRTDSGREKQTALLAFGGRHALCEKPAGACTARGGAVGGSRWALSDGWSAAEPKTAAESGPELPANTSPAKMCFRTPYVGYKTIHAKQDIGLACHRGGAFRVCRPHRHEDLVRGIDRRFHRWLGRVSALRGRRQRGCEQVWPTALPRALSARITGIAPQRLSRDDAAYLAERERRQYAVGGDLSAFHVA